MLQQIHRNLRLLAGALALLATAHASGGENRWTSQGPFGGNIQTLAVDPLTPAIVYAGTWDAGVFKSTDHGATWTPANEGLPANRFVSVLIVDPASSETLYTIVNSSVDFARAYKSTDRGEHWQPLDTGFSDPRLVAGLTIDPSHPATLYAFGHQEVVRTVDGGATWEAVDSQLDVHIAGLTVDPSDSAKLYAATDDGVYRSTDGGIHWTRLSGGVEGILFTDVVIDPEDPDTIYATLAPFSPTRLFRSRDGGDTWTDLSSAVFPLRAFLIDPTSTQVLYAATSNNGAVLRSTDGGDSWSVGSDGIDTLDLTSLAIDPLQPTRLYLGAESDAGVFKSTDAGATWAASNHGLSNTRARDVAVDPANPSNLYAATDHGIFQSGDGGGTWTAAELRRRAPDMDALAVDPLDPATVYAGGQRRVPPGGSGVYKTSDAGATWELLDGLVVSTRIGDLEIDPQSPSTVFAATTLGLFRSRDGGDTWTQAEEITVSFDVEIDPRTPTTLYSAGSGASGLGRIAKSLDGGDTWFPAAAGLDPFTLNIPSLAIDPQNPATVYATGPPGVFKSTDGAASWFLAGALSNSVFPRALAVDPQTPSTVYTTTVEGVSKSVDGGATWLPLGEGLTHPVVDLEVDPQRPVILHAGTVGGGVFSLVQDIDCVPGAKNLCLDDEPGDQRFEVTLAYDTDLGAGAAGDAEATPLTSLGITHGGVLSFFDAANPEVLVKVLDGCGTNDHFWVFYAATTTAGFQLRVTDTVTGASRAYTNEDQHIAATVTDVEAFPCGPAPESLLSFPSPPLPPSPSHPPHPPGERGEKKGPSLFGVEGRAEAPLSLGGRGGWEGEGMGVRGSASCVPDGNTLCIHGDPGDGRFRISASYDTVLGAGAAGDAAAVSLAPVGITRGGILWFFDEDNPEILVKVLDGCGSNGHYWVFYAATTTVGFTLTIEDTVAGEELVFVHPDLQAAAPHADILAFATCGNS